MEVYDPYHPLMEDITISNFQAFDSNKVVANAALNAGSEAAGDVPRICSGNLDVAEFNQSFGRNKTKRRLTRPLQLWSRWNDNLYNRC